VFSDDDEGGQRMKEDDELSVVTMTQEEFFKMLEDETRKAIEKLRQSHDDEAFLLYAEAFLKQLEDGEFGPDIGGKAKRKALIEYIRELDKRERKRIEEKYRKLFEEARDKRKKLKRKRRQQAPIPSSGKFDPYFRYLPFEKAVIESNGRTPYNNQHVEKISRTKTSEMSSPAISPILTRKGTLTNKATKPFSLKP